MGIGNIQIPDKRRILRFFEIFKLTSSLGDINDDGGIDILDIVSLINLILDEGYQSNADINEDGNLNVLDVVSLINIILG